MSLLFLITSLGHLQWRCLTAHASCWVPLTNAGGEAPAAKGIMFPYAFIPQPIQYSKNPILFERDIANLV